LSKSKQKGHVEFRQPAAKLVVELPEDEQVQEELAEARMHSGFHGTCGINLPENQEKEE
jgi:hypothetical protein